MEWALEAGLEQTVCEVGLLVGVKPVQCREDSSYRFGYGISNTLQSAFSNTYLSLVGSISY